MVWGFQCECTIVSDGRLMQETIQYCHDSHVILNEWRKEHNKGPFKKYVRSSISTFDLLPPSHTHVRFLNRKKSLFWYGLFVFGRPDPSPQDERTF